MSAWLRSLGMLVALALTSRVNLARGAIQEQELVLEVRVTDSSGGALFLDRGRLDGLAIEDRVQLFPAGSAPLEARLVAVSAKSSRAELLQPGTLIPIGTPGEVRIPKSRLAPENTPLPKAPKVELPPAEGPTAKPQVVPAPLEHPPWEAGQGDFDASQPLLQSLTGSKPAERQPTWRGRMRFSLDGSRSGEASIDSLTTRSALYLEGTNPFGRGGALVLEGEGFLRAYDADGGSDDDLLGRIERAFYRWGGDRERPLFWQAGRFFQNGLPRLGRLDGFEISQRDESSGSRFGVSVGLQPLLDSTLSISDEFQIAGFYQRPIGDDGASSWTVGVQKTWYQGNSDRDLLIGNIYAQPLGFRLYGDLLVDYYASKTDLQRAGFELTEYNLSLDRPLGKALGVGLFANRFSWPDLKSNAAQGILPQTILEGPRDRQGVSAWWQANKRWRFDARMDQFTDSVNSGGSSELRAQARDFLIGKGSLSWAIFENRSGSADQQGLRTDAWIRLDELRSLRLGYSLTQFDPQAAGSTQSSFTQNLATLSYDGPAVFGWDMSLYLNQVFGSGSQATNFGLLLTRRF